MHDHYDRNQTLVPEWFLALHSRNGRPLRPRAEIEARHELCVRRAAELRDWAQPAWLADTDSDADRSGRW